MRSVWYNESIFHSEPFTAAHYILPAKFPYAHMHFYYLDESGDTGTNLVDKNQPIFVLGGTRVRETGWNSTQQVSKNSPPIISVVQVFPRVSNCTHSELLGPQGKGPFAEHSDEKRYGLCISILDLLLKRKHGFHYFAASKHEPLKADVEAPIGFNPKIPYLLAFDTWSRISLGSAAKTGHNPARDDYPRPETRYAQ